MVNGKYWTCTVESGTTTFEECVPPSCKLVATTCSKCCTTPTLRTILRCQCKRTIHRSGHTLSTTHCRTVATFHRVQLNHFPVYLCLNLFESINRLSWSLSGVWEVGMVMWNDLRGGRCSMGDACTNPADEGGVYEMLMKNFNRHYKSNRAPFSLYYHSAWFNTQHHKKGFMKFLDEITGHDDVYMVTTWQTIQWVREPKTLDEMKSFAPFKCDRPKPIGECTRPNFCNVNSKQGSRTLRTCQECPAVYPWIDNNGFGKIKSG